ncbi:hypothetical protein LguiA_030934 [Lonicera macranthoides]
MEQLKSSNTQLIKSSNTQLAEVPITLRRFDLSDADDLMVWTIDEKVSQFCGWDHTGFSKDKAIDVIANTIIPHPYYRAIRVDNRTVGEVSVKPRAGCESCRAEIGYVLAYDYWGRGIATKAVKMVINEIFGVFPNLERIEGTVDVENMASQRVLDKCGFKREGVLRKYLIHKGKTIDMIMFSLLRTDPKIE